MKVVIVSDSHGDFNTIKKLVLDEEPFDLLVHLGDGIQEGIRLKKIRGFDFQAVTGNNDPGGLYPSSITLKWGSQICFFTHGDQYQTHINLEELFRAARIEKANWVFFGHTHCVQDQVYKEVRFINPGAVAFHLSKNPSYVVLEIINDQILIEIKKVSC